MGDLGCGFGFMMDGIAGEHRRVGEIVGVDMHRGNRDAFLERAGAVADTARFVCTTLDSRLDFPSSSFEAVIASYSLYYFPGIIPEVARVLAPDGVFLSVTHSESYLARLLEATGFSVEKSGLRGVLHEFSAENGSERLAPHFAVVTSRPYRNTLVFRSGDVDDFIALLRFKLPSLLPARAVAPGRAGTLLERARRLLADAGSVTIAKDDTPSSVPGRSQD